MNSPQSVANLDRGSPHVGQGNLEEPEHRTSRRAEREERTLEAHWQPPCLQQGGGARLSLDGSVRRVLTVASCPKAQQRLVDASFAAQLVRSFWLGMRQALAARAGGARGATVRPQRRGSRRGPSCSARALRMAQAWNATHVNKKHPASQVALGLCE